MAAAEAGYAAIVEMLVARGAKPDARDAKGVTALILARKNGRADVARFLENIPESSSSNPG